RAQSPAARRDRHLVHRRQARRAVGDSLRDHARRRHTASARRRGTARRHPGPPAESAPARAAPRPRRRGLRDPPAADRPDSADPARYEVASARQHGWARGDWQLLPWLIRGAAGAGTSRARIPTIGRWKMLDNLRRTLSAPAAYLTLVLGWTLPAGASMVWTKLV